VLPPCRGNGCQDFLPLDGAVKNGEDYFWNNALSYACKNGNLDVFKLLLINGVGNVKQTDFRGVALRMFACYFGHIDAVELILSGIMFDINARDKYGNTALMYACGGWNAHIIALLLK
jgi:ankyrin repeat protein